MFSFINDICGYFQRRTLKVGDLVRVTKPVGDFDPSEALVIVNVANMTKKWTIADVIRPGSSDPRVIDLAWLQKWEDGSTA